MSSNIVVGISDMKLARNEGMLVTYALGSCIGICLYDPVIKLAALVHIMLPVKLENSNDNVFKFADTGIPETLRKMEVFGAVRNRIVAKIAGGARMFDIPGNGSLGNIGMRNIESVKQTLRVNGIRLLKEDVGANYARTLYFDCKTGNGVIKSYGRTEIVL